MSNNKDDSLVYLSNHEINFSESIPLLSEGTVKTICPQKNENTVEVVKKEYSVVGDGLYASINTDEAPEWLTAIIDSVVSSSIDNNFTDYDLLVQDVRSAIDSIDVAKNTYVEQINITPLIDGILASRLQTLNATYDGKFATIVGLQLAVATSESASAALITDVVAEFSEDINSRVTNVQTAYADADESLANSIESLSTVFANQAEDLSGTADAVSGLQTYVGLTIGNNPDGTGLLGRMDIVEKQNDGVIVYYTGQYDVMINVVEDDGNSDDDEIDVTQEPYASWISEDTTNENQDVRSQSVGDVYIQYSSDGDYVKSYKFIKTAQDLTDPYSTDSEGYTWALILDNNAAAAYALALTAKDLADNKRRVFTTTPSGPYDKGDLWIKLTVPPQVLMVCKLEGGRGTGFNYGDWEVADQQSKDFVNNTYNPEVGQIRRQIDGKIEYYFYDTFSSVAGATNESSALAIIDSDWNTQSKKDSANGNVVYFKNTKNGYWYSASLDSWLAITDTSIYQALEDASSAKGAADGKVSQFYAWGGTGAPADYVTNPSAAPADRITAKGSNFLYWFKTNNSLYYKPSSTWVVVPSVSGNGTYISEGDIVTVLDPLTGDVTLHSFNGTSWQITGPQGIISKSRFFVDLENEVKGPTGIVATAISDLKIENEAYTDDEVIKINNTFSYNSEIYIKNGAANGSYYKSGFGLNSSAITQIEDGTTPETAFDSEFWINAKRLVLTNPDDPSIQAVFNVTASGITLGLEHTEATRNETKGEYSASTNYTKGDIVTYLGSSYSATEDVVNVSPDSGSSSWQLFASKGTNSVQYKIRIPDGTAIKNSTGSINFRGSVVDGGTQTDLSSGDIKLYTAGGTDLGYAETFDASDISGSVDVVLKNSNTGFIHDSVTFVDITDGVDAFQSYLEWTGSVILTADLAGQTNAQVLTWVQAVNQGSYVPAAELSEYDTVFVKAGVEYARRRTVVKQLGNTVNVVRESAVSSLAGYSTDRIWTGRATESFVAQETLIFNSNVIHTSNPSNFITVASGSEGNPGNPGNPGVSAVYGTIETPDGTNWKIDKNNNHIPDASAKLRVIVKFFRGFSEIATHTLEIKLLGAGVSYDSTSGLNGIIATRTGYSFNRSFSFKYEGVTVTETFQALFDGIEGGAGAGLYGDTYSSISWNVTTANNRFAVLAGRQPVNNDIFTQTLTNGSDSQSKQYTSSSNSWEGVLLKFNGSILATRSVAGDTLIAGTEITSPVVTGGTIRTATGTSRRVEISSAGNFPIWVGSGTKNAENSIMHVDSAGNSAFKGSVYARNLEGDVYDALSINVPLDITIPRNNNKMIFRLTIDANTYFDRRFTVSVNCEHGSGSGGSGSLNRLVLRGYRNNSEITNTTNLTDIDGLNVTFTLGLSVPMSTSETTIEIRLDTPDSSSGYVRRQAIIASVFKEGSSFNGLIVGSNSNDPGGTPGFGGNGGGYYWP